LRGSIEKKKGEEASLKGWGVCYWGGRGRKEDFCKKKKENNYF
jgi:hypothetical protein